MGFGVEQTWDQILALSLAVQTGESVSQLKVILPDGGEECG